MVIYRDGEFLLGGFLPDYILVKEFFDLERLRDLVRCPSRRLNLVVLKDRVAYSDALVADVSSRVIAGGRDQLSNYILAFMAKRTAQSIVGSGTLQAVFSCSAIGCL
jgi:hypothetical protein